jgi:hypothetical protein
MDAKSAAGVPLSSPNAAQRCAEGAGLDSGASAAAQSAMPSIAACSRTDRRQPFHRHRCVHGASAQSPISTSLTDVTLEKIGGGHQRTGACHMASDEVFS